MHVSQKLVMDNGHAKRFYALAAEANANTTAVYAHFESAIQLLQQLQDNLLYA